MKKIIRPPALVWAAITECHRLGGLNDRYLFLIVLEAGNTNIKVASDSLSGDSPLPSLYTAGFSLCVHMAFDWCLLMKREKALVSFPLLIRALIAS